MRLLALIVGALLHLVALYLLVTHGPLGWALLAHLLGSVLWGWGITLIFPSAYQLAWWLPAGIALLFPVFGPLTTLALARVLHLPPVDRSARRYVIWNEEQSSALADTLPAGAAGQSIVEILQSPRTQL